MDPNQMKQMQSKQEQAQKQAAQQEYLYNDNPRQIEDMKEQALNRILTKEANSRLANISMVKPKKAQMLTNRIIQLAKAGQLNGKMDEPQLIGMLESLNDAVTKDEPTITVIFRGFDPLSSREEVLIQQAKRTLMMNKMR